MKSKIGNHKKLGIEIGDQKKKNWKYRRGENCQNWEFSFCFVNVDKILQSCRNAKLVVNFYILVLQKIEKSQKVR